jgi:hypothetical protein
MLCGEGNARYQRLVKTYVAEEGERLLRTFLPPTKQFIIPTAMYS